MNDRKYELTTRGRRLHLLHLGAQHGDVRVDVVARLRDVDSLAVLVHLQRGVVVAHLDVLHELLVAREDGGQHLEEGHELNEVEHALHAYTLVESFDQR